MKIDGHCHCGQITFEAEVDPNSVMICHCTDCQRLSGSAGVLAALHWVDTLASVPATEKG